MNAFATLGNSVREVDLVFFHGSKEELIKACKESSGEDTTGDADNITITVIERGNPKSSTEPVQIRAKKGVNLRQVLTDNGINVYQSVTRWTNCKGKQLCGTCIVDIKEGAFNTNRKSMDEESTLRENPEGYRLSCITFAYGDVTVETFPPVSASQWTR
jgi:ferredoxin